MAQRFDLSRGQFVAVLSGGIRSSSSLVVTRIISSLFSCAARHDGDFIRLRWFQRRLAKIDSTGVVSIYRTTYIAGMKNSGAVCDRNKTFATFAAVALALAVGGAEPTAFELAKDANNRRANELLERPPCS